MAVQVSGADARPVLAVDIGGTKIAVGLVNAEGTVRARRQAPTGPEPATTLDTLIGDVLDEGGWGPLAGVGIGCGGPMRWPEGIVSPLNIPAWADGYPLRQRLAERFPGIPVRLHNDALAFVAAEHWRGAARGHDNALGVVVSTGVGGGLVLDGTLRSGPTGNAGHVGHVVVDSGGPPCGCGGHGCVEAVARGPAMVAWARAQGLNVGDGGALAAAARAGDAVAAAAFRRSGRAVGQGLAGVAASLDLDVVVLGGGIASTGDLLLDHVRKAFAEYGAMSYVRRTIITGAALGADAGLVGAAALVLRGDRYWSAD